MHRVSSLLCAALAAAAPVRLAAQDAVRDTGRAPQMGVFVQIRARYDSSAVTTLVQRARVSLDGPIAPRFRYHLQAGYEAGDGLLLIDASIRWTVGFATVTAGQFKTPFAREYVIPLPQLETLDRSYAVDQLAPRRDVGVMGEFALGSDSLAIAIVNGEGQNVLQNKDSALLVVSRFVAHPVKIVALGADVAYYGPDSVRFALDGNLELPRLALRGTYLAQHRASVGSNDFGWSALAAASVTRDVQLVARQEDFERPGISAALRTVTTIAGVNVDLSGPAVVFGIDFISRRVGTPGTRTNTLLAQLEARL